jgi:carbamoyl-phosphate synthase large subunit
VNIFIEATGSLVSFYMIKAIKEAGYRVIGSDVSDFNHAKYLCDDFIIMPKIIDKDLWKKTLALLVEHKVDIVIPSLDETMIDWAKRVEEFKNNGIRVIISPQNTIEIFQDKYKTYNFFKEFDIPTPKTSLDAIYELIKPRLGRGGSGIFKNNFKNNFSMDGMISQEMVHGEEYTVDVFFSKDFKPIYIVPRKRIDVKDGKSTKGMVVNNPKIDKLITKISNNIKFLGPINFQLFETKKGGLFLIEVNPRIAGGMALGFAASENWINLIVENILNEKTISVKNIDYGLKMTRYYSECFFK